MNSSAVNIVVLPKFSVFGPVNSKDLENVSLVGVRMTQALEVLKKH